MPHRAKPGGMTPPYAVNSGNNPASWVVQQFEIPKNETTRRMDTNREHYGLRIGLPVVCLALSN
jgi:hypothetical protein